MDDLYFVKPRLLLMRGNSKTYWSKVYEEIIGLNNIHYDINTYNRINTDMVFNP
jgi:hypothetical protein